MLGSCGVLVCCCLEASEKDGSGDVRGDEASATEMRTWPIGPSEMSENCGLIGTNFRQRLMSIHGNTTLRRS